MANIVGDDGCGVSSSRITTLASSSNKYQVETTFLLPTPQEFYQRFVRKRAPVILRQQAAIVFDNPNLFNDLKLSNLKKICHSENCSNDTVEVNMVAINGDGNPSFSPLHGSGVVSLSWSALCESISKSNNDSPYYMTTQTLPVDDEGRPAVFSWLSNLLIRRGILPLRPPLAGNLIPMSCAGIWLGRTNGSAKNISSSGLHHDRHDNVYGVITGRKQIRIAPPQAVHDLRMVGTLHTRHENGRIVYQEDLRGEDHDDSSCPIRPDGALVSVERVMELELRRAAIEEILDGLLDQENQREALEQERNDIEEKLLEHEMEDDVLSEASDDGESPSSSDKEEGEPPQKKTKRSATENVPSNFVVEENGKVNFELVELAAGDVLYLPAGWFHEVSSMGNIEQDNDNGVHMAVNYWFHPPDMTTKVSFDQPYKSRFWQQDWDARQLGN